YGIATPKGSPWRDKISLAILELQEKGDIQMLYDKWWKNTGETCIRNRNNKKSKANALGLDNIGGVFVVLIVGIGFAICVAMFEFWQHYKFQQKELAEFLSRPPDDDLQKSQQYVDVEHNIKVTSHQEYHYQSHQYITQPVQHQRSLWIEMFDEFHYALRCMDRRQRPALKRRCSQCHLFKSVTRNDIIATTEATTTINSINKRRTKQTIKTTLK
ncbi:glutamate receptor 3.3-like, partial [Lucilia sericata]|uniref:glutamate receptor 3.3-like n=1 Tax=Lucilia sericata TaxID=13632 RepID=UPI0018A84FD0